LESKIKNAETKIGSQRAGFSQTFHYTM